MIGGTFAKPHKSKLKPSYPKEPPTQTHRQKDIAAKMKEILREK